MPCLLCGSDHAVINLEKPRTSALLSWTCSDRHITRYHYKCFSINRATLSLSLSLFSTGGQNRDMRQIQRNKIQKFVHDCNLEECNTFLGGALKGMHHRSLSFVHNILGVEFSGFTCVCRAAFLVSVSSFVILRSVV